MLELILGGLLAGLLLLGIWEYGLHLRRLRTIPTRIHVNGTRGKSSVVRLIAAGLRAGGLRTFAKTTGTLPRMIMQDGREFPVFRPSKANIIEQLRIVSLAASARAEVLVLECMALQPVLQSLCELRLIRATHGVITNSRPDHLDVMGPGTPDVARALAGTTPVGTRMYTAERDMLPVFEEACADRGSELVSVCEAEVAAVGEEDLAGFSYREHAENVALALKVCEDLGVDRAVALKGMWVASPDPGAMREYRVLFHDRELLFVNGFAANDPQSTEQIWRMTLAAHPDYERRLLVVNCRQDRPDRSRQLAEVVGGWPTASAIVVCGTGTYVFVRNAVEHGLDASRLVNAEGYGAQELFEALIGLSQGRALAMGIGNIGGGGLDFVAYLKNRTVLPRGRGTAPGLLEASPASGLLPAAEVGPLLEASGELTERPTPSKEA